MSQLITIQVGQCGNQIGAALWPLILQEYGYQKTIKQNLHPSFDSFFYIPNGNFTNSNLSDMKQNFRARAILIDMEDGVISMLKSGSLKHLFDDKYIVTNYPGSGNNWAEGHCYHGPKYESKILNVVRSMVDICDNLQGFLVLLSTGGGTGSGLGTYILKLLYENYPHIDRFVICVYPIGTEDVITCPYNMLLCTDKLLEYASCVFPIENRALLDIINRQSEDSQNFITGYRPFQDMNSIIVNMILHLTSGCRFSGNLNIDMNDINTNMVPFPKMQFLASAYSPHTVCSTKIQNNTKKQTKDNLFLSVCSRNSELLKIDSTGLNSVLMGCTLIGRGDFTVTDMRGYIDKLQKKSKFTNWSKKAIKVGLCGRAPVGQNVAMLGLFNTSSMGNLFLTINKHFMKLYRKKVNGLQVYGIIEERHRILQAHIHHYQLVENFDVVYFEESYNAILDSINSYREIQKYQPVIIDRLKPIDY